MSEVNKTVEELGSLWEQFKTTNDARLAEIEASGKATSETLTKLDRIDSAMTMAEENRKRIEQIESTATLVQHADDDGSDADRQHRDAFYKWAANPYDRVAKQELYESEKAVTLTTTGLQVAA